MKKAFKEIYRTTSALGGVVYRVSSNGESVNIASSDRGAGWRIVKRMTHESFERWAESVGLYDVYDQNPAKLARLAHD